ncbi:MULTISPECIES: SAM-dependent methyltransferase [unclassified Streptomyces]|uniref:SAM-dependent methyltransferase n=1 Tax=Streptomyces sp. NBC_00060 TaxID=2975636 RepID=A0AAU2HD75_9ACTN
MTTARVRLVDSAGAVAGGGEPGQRQRLTATAEPHPGTERLDRIHAELVVTSLARRGLQQFIDVRLPMLRGFEDDLHRIARRIQPQATWLCIDHELPSPRARRTPKAMPGGAPVLRARFEEMEQLLDAAEARLERTQPIAALLHDVLFQVRDAPARAGMVLLREWLAAGSAVSLTHPTPDLIRRARPADVTARPAPLFQGRRRAQIAALLDGFHQVGRMVPTHQWHPAHPHRGQPGWAAGSYAALAFTPHPSAKENACT